MSTCRQLEGNSKAIMGVLPKMRTHKAGSLGQLVVRAIVIGLIHNVGALDKNKGLHFGVAASCNFWLLLLRSFWHLGVGAFVHGW